MPNPICEKCRQDQNADHSSVVQSTGCADSYAVVDRCMKQFNGNISNCKVEWENFNTCLKSQKKDVVCRR